MRAEDLGYAALLGAAMALVVIVIMTIVSALTPPTSIYEITSDGIHYYTDEFKLLPEGFVEIDRYIIQRLVGSETVENPLILQGNTQIVKR